MQTITGLLNSKQEKGNHSDVSLIPTFVTQLPTVEFHIKFYSFRFADSKEGTVEQDDDPRILGSLSYQNFKAFDDSDSRYFVTPDLSLFKHASQFKKC